MTEAPLDQGKRQSEKISFNAWLIKCISEAVANHRQLQAIRQGGKLVLFEDVDISIVIEGKSMAKSPGPTLSAGPMKKHRCHR